jgi:hypothetical protein
MNTDEKRRQILQKRETLYLAEVVNLPVGHDYPFKDGEHVLVLGEIRHMPGHVAVVAKDGGAVHYAYHAENFRMLRPEEV